MLVQRGKQYWIFVWLGLNVILSCFMQTKKHSVGDVLSDMLYYLKCVRRMNWTATSHCLLKQCLYFDIWLICLRVPYGMLDCVRDAWPCVHVEWMSDSRLMNGIINQQLQRFIHILHYCLSVWCNDQNKWKYNGFLRRDKCREIMFHKSGWAFTLNAVFILIFSNL